MPNTFLFILIYFCCLVRTYRDLQKQCKKLKIMQKERALVKELPLSLGKGFKGLKGKANGTASKGKTGFFAG